MDVTTPPAQPGTNDACQRVNRILGRMGDKWTILTITSLTGEPQRFNALKRMIGGISQQMLTRTLKALERDDVITRTVYPTVPPQVEYALTPLGQSLAVPIMQLAGWVLEHLDVVEEHQRAHDRLMSGDA